ncbi:hypothetical protein Mapa_013647 [Marchantia paleacea]|nr:hypothetical protein Mapa_013647 [Marchantia paleacea]
MSTASVPRFMKRSDMSSRWCTIRLLVSILFLSSVDLMPSSKASAALVPEEENALQVLRESFDLPQWTGDPCGNDNVSWITCSNSSSFNSSNSQFSNVVAIDLNSKNLSGTIPVEILQLRQTRDLFLNQNMLRGSIPSFSNMTNLTNLELSGNMLSGTIPDNLIASSDIRQIMLNDNNLTGGIPASLFKHRTAERIMLQQNPLGGPIPDLSELTKLTHLYLENTQLTGNIPVTIRNMTSVQQINFKTNPELKGPLPDFSGLSNLQYLDLRYCGLSGSLPELKESEALLGIQFSDNNFSGSIPPALFQQKNQVQWLEMENNPGLSGNVPDVSQLTGLEILKIYDCNVSGPLPTFETNSLLRFLLLQNNHLTAFPSDMRVLTKLEGINVANNSISGGLPLLPAGSNQTNTDGYRLKDLTFSNNNFSGEIPKSWSELTFLENLSLDFNSLSGVIPTDFGNLTKLKTLDLRNNSFSGPIPDDLGRLENLLTLDLRNNNFNGTVPESLALITNLTELRLENNNFAKIPEALVLKQGLNITYDPNVEIVSEKNSSSGFPTGGIVGVSIGAVVAVIAILALVLYRSRKSKNGDQLSKEDMPKSAKAFTLKQIKRITENNKTLIGKGGFGPVYYGKLSDGKEVAVKIRSTDSKQGAGEFLNEVRLLSRLHHRNLVPLVGYCLEAKQQILVYVYMPQGTLDHHLHHTGSGSNPLDTKPDNSSTNQHLSWRTRLNIALEAARGLEYLHKDCNPPIIHRDVKSSNILLGDKLQAKVADLGISKQAPEPDPEALDMSGVSTAIKGTFGYLDPEYYVRRKLTTKSDVYSFGIVLLELITGKRPYSDKFPDSNETNLIEWVRAAVSDDGQVDAVVDPSLGGEYEKKGVERVIRMALSCVLPNGAQRPDMGDVMNILAEALQMEGEIVDNVEHAAQRTVPYSGELNSGRPRISSTHTSDYYVSSEVYTHPSWNTDPR